MRWCPPTLEVEQCVDKTWLTNNTWTRDLWSQHNVDSTYLTSIALTLIICTWSEHNVCENRYVLKISPVNDHYENVVQFTRSPEKQQKHKMEPTMICCMIKINKTWTDKQNEQFQSQTKACRNHNQHWINSEHNLNYFTLN